jgi:metal-responsive CopG/Arc/MetJ family transcriptional regulator
MVKPAKESVSVSLNCDLVGNLDLYCHLKEMDRSQVVQKAIRKFLAAECAELNPQRLDEVYAEWIGMS